MPTELPLWLERLLGYVRVDFAPRHRQPSAVAVVIATAVSIAGSLAADAVLVMIGKKAFPKTAHYGHFQFSDYGKLTVIGVLIACVAWPIVTRISSEPRWLFFRQAIAVTLVLLLPDLYILYKGQPAEGVAVLMVMHVAIGVVTYNALVHIAKVGEPEDETGRRGGHSRRGDLDQDGQWDRGEWDRGYAPAPSASAGSQGYDDYYRDSRDAGRRDVQPTPSRQEYQGYQDYQDRGGYQNRGDYQDYYRDSQPAGRRDVQPAPSRQEYQPAPSRQEYQPAPSRQEYQDYPEQERWDYGARDRRPAADGRRDDRGSWEPRREARSASRSRRHDDADPWT